MLTISANSIPGRIYSYWLKMGGGNRPGYQENFCHFCRVLLVWAPLKFFLSQKIVWIVRPWMLVALAGYVWLFTISPDAALAVAMLVAIPTGLTLLGYVLVMGLFKTANLVVRSKNRAARWLTHAVESAAHWLSFKQYGRWFRPWMAAAVLFHVATFLWTREVFYVIILLEGVIAGMVAFMLIRFRIEDSETVVAVTQAFSARAVPITRPIKTVGGAGYARAKAAKGPICPPVQDV